MYTSNNIVLKCVIFLKIHRHKWPNDYMCGQSYGWLENGRGPTVILYSAMHKSGSICNCIYITLILFYISDTTTHATAPTAPPKMTFNVQENIPPPSENIRQLSASPQKPRSPNLYPVLSELQQKLSTVNQPGQPSSPTPSTQRTPVASPTAPKATNYPRPDHKVRYYNTIPTLYHH